MRLIGWLLMMLLFSLAGFSQQKQSLNTHTYCWEGKIAPNIPAFLWFTIKDSIAVGQIKYTKAKSGKPIKVIGYIIEDGGLKLHEISERGSVTGVFYGKMNINAFTGTWFSPKTRQSVDFQFKSKDTLVKNLNTEFEPKSIVGKYHYSYGKGGAEGNLTVSKPGKSFVANFSNYGDAPSRSLAEIKLEPLNLKKNEVIEKLDDGDACVFRIRFLENFVVVTYIDNRRDCGFGNGAEIEGVYSKIK